MYFVPEWLTRKLHFPLENGEPIGYFNTYITNPTSQKHPVCFRRCAEQASKLLLTMVEVENEGLITQNWKIHGNKKEEKSQIGTIGG